jgi:hypothetical protein
MSATETDRKATFWSKQAKAQNKQKLERMEKSFKYRWTNLSADKQKELVDRLLDKELLPETVGQVLDAFDGCTVVSLV